MTSVIPTISQVVQVSETSVIAVPPTRLLSSQILGRVVGMHIKGHVQVVRPWISVGPKCSLKSFFIIIITVIGTLYEILALFESPGNKVVRIL